MQYYQVICVVFEATCITCTLAYSVTTVLNVVDLCSCNCLKCVRNASGHFYFRFCAYILHFSCYSVKSLTIGNSHTLYCIVSLVTSWKMCLMPIVSAEAAISVSCNFQKSDKCGYTTGSCWNSNLLSYDTYGKPGATVHVTMGANLLSYLQWVHVHKTKTTFYVQNTENKIQYKTRNPLGPKITGSRPSFLEVTWRHRSRDHSNRHASLFSYWLFFGTEHLSGGFRDICTGYPNTCGSRPWLFRVSW